jgi:hypothetical protein
MRPGHRSDRHLKDEVLFGGQRPVPRHSVRTESGVWIERCGGGHSDSSGEEQVAGQNIYISQVIAILQQWGWIVDDHEGVQRQICFKNILNSETMGISANVVITISQLQ